jgi:hypothetical protein
VSGKRTVIGGDERGLVALEAIGLVALGTDRKLPADTHQGIGMQEAVGARSLDAEKQVEIGGKKRRLARLVRAVHKMEIRFARRRRAEIEAAIGEFSVADEVQAIETHALVLPALRRQGGRARHRSPRRARSCSRASSAASSGASRLRASFGNWRRMSASVSRNSSR